MLFELPEYDEAFVGFASSVMNELARAGDPILSQIGSERSPGALGSVFRDKDGEDVELESQLIGTDITANKDDILHSNKGALAVMLSNGAENLQVELKKMFFGTLQTVTDATGNVVDAGGKLTFEHFYEMLSKIERSLTEDDQLSPVSIVMSPEMRKKLPVETPEQKAMIEELEKRQLEELLAKRRFRRLS